MAPAPTIDELVNTERSTAMIKKINGLKLERGLKVFLLAAAARHNVFHYENIAEYYAHSDAEVQEIFDTCQHHQHQVKMKVCLLLRLLLFLV